MNLLNRYLQAVGKYLPKARREDILAELRANLLSQIEDREEQLGRAVIESELKELLQQHGNPAIVAGRYFPENHGLAFGRQLIGPELFPFYKTILLMNLGITLAIVAVVLPLVSRAFHEPIPASRSLIPLVAQFAAVTLIFILLDRGKGHVLNNWDPGNLPVVKAPEDGPNAHNIFTFIATAVGTLWLALTPQWPFLLLGPGALYLQSMPMKLMPSWPMFYWEIVALLCAQLVLQFFSLFKMLERRRARNANLILKCWGLSIGVHLLLKAPNYITSTHQEIAAWANLTFLICLIVALAINLFGMGRLLYSLLRERDQMLPARQY